MIATSMSRQNFSGHGGRVGIARRMAQNGTTTHEIAR